ncbi:Regulator of chromosome condensation (RCC1) family protein [Rhynchospora pubera]|uniref:Regulator of chromosome condensation (RCC1) family protein n=1 Tax=Rhynchospora pubera TaxID=906938 RepID=A0AAV8F794_9POAL|nr:Regulator of chromosome condensation (RCC1) family protein [Rhynchospora pubera]
MAHKVVSIAAGEAHTLVLTGDGSIYSWGRGLFGRLGTGKEDDELIPAKVSFNPSSKNSASLYPQVGGTNQPKFVGIATGAYHSLALADDGSVWSWGYNSYGQLGYGKENSSVPCLVEQLEELGSDSSARLPGNNTTTTPLKICSVRAGGMMSFAIDNLGSLWMWGQCPQPTDTGELCLISTPSPLPVWDFHGRTVVKVACGNEHVVAAVTSGESYTGSGLICYSWGSNTHGQLGLGHKESQPRPVVIPTFNEESSWEVYEMACGAHHTAILAQKKSYGEDIQCRCWTFGLGDNGQLGNGSTISSDLPIPVIGLPGDAFLISLDCGLFHTAVVSADGEVWCWGMEKGLGLCPDASYSGADAGDALHPLRVRSPETNGFKFLGPIQISCGAAHTVLVAGEGYRMWAWGRGRNGVLGRGVTNDSYTPAVVSWPPLNEQDIKELQGGGSSGSSLERNEMERETERRLSEAMERLSLMERYANMLHISIFRKQLDERKLKESFQGKAVFDIRREFESLLGNADGDELMRMEGFYRSMLASVKDEILKRRVREMVNESLASMSMGRRHG